jgi:hypothetical protein
LLRGITRLLRGITRLLRGIAGLPWLRGIAGLPWLRGIAGLLLVLAGLCGRRLLVLLAAGSDPTGTEHAEYGGPKHNHSRVSHTSPG